MHRVIYTSFVFCVRFFSLPFFAASMLSLSSINARVFLSFTLTQQITKAIWFHWIYSKPLKATCSLFSVHSSALARCCCLFPYTLFWSFAAQTFRSILYIVWTEWVCEFFYGFFVSLIAWYCIFIAYRSLFHLHCRWHWFLIRKMSVADLWMEAVTPWVNCVKLSQPNTIA